MKIFCYNIKSFEIEGICKMILRENKLCIIGLFLLIFLTSSFTVTCDAISSGATILLWIILLIMSVFVNRFLQKKVFIIYIVIVWLYIASTIVFDSNCSFLPFCASLNKASSHFILVSSLSTKCDATRLLF